ncbi:MAG: Tic22 family protein [Pseudanabaenaceae cyanobacterium]
MMRQLMAVTSSLLLGIVTPAVAMTEQQVISRLSSVPLFVLMTPQNEPVALALNNKGKEVQIIRFYLSYNDAQVAMQDLQRVNPPLARQVRIVAASMPQFFELQKQKKSPNVEFVLVPARNSLEATRAVLREQGKPDNQFEGIPVFYATADKNGSVIMIEEGGKKFTPFYFDRSDLQNFINEYRKANPQAPQPRIEVVPLDRVISSMIATPTSKPDPTSATFQFVPSSSAVQKALETQGKR